MELCCPPHTKIFFEYQKFLRLVIADDWEKKTEISSIIHSQRLRGSQCRLQTHFINSLRWFIGSGSFQQPASGSVLMSARVRRAASLISGRQFASNLPALIVILPRSTCGRWSQISAPRKATVKSFVARPSSSPIFHNPHHTHTNWTRRLCVRPHMIYYRHSTSISCIINSDYAWGNWYDWDKWRCKMSEYYSLDLRQWHTSSIHT